MSCVCRFRPWNMFVRSLAQVHRLEPAASWGAVRLAAAAPAWAIRGRLSRQQQQHAFYASTTKNDKTPQDDSKAPIRGAQVAPSQSSRIDDMARILRGARNGGRKAREKNTSFAKSSVASTRPGPGRMVTSASLGGGQAKEGDSDGESDVAPPRSTWGRKMPWEPMGGDNYRANRPPRATRREEWKAQKRALDAKYPDGWKPRKKLSPDALEGLRALNAQFPDVYTTEALADRFAMSPEAIRRILRSKWRPTADEEQDRQERWHRRGMRVWERKAALGIKPPKRWRLEGVTRDPSHHERSLMAAMREEEIEQREIEKYKAARPWLDFAAPSKGEETG